ncbi:MBL fold metallo-hydrolase RNA specificity domain-containing protein [Dethiosulfatarculus sandiegensis]|uniref:Metallo-beta-lactamase n=1 Tax=Dethiosulfatarculus sandiegensis TaxID=1429043 RepID=A0A0D2JBH7_9BACT|nr:MBL fold metallo-hydrolase [Dethiosulfatarculus sandiegensis]KIX13096.1 metallo-beta-lactamase [Dethiosulfatarculus sandiegensis]
MQITCLGAARTVTGSCYMVQVDPDVRFLVDCGMYQGGRQLEARNWQTHRYRPQEIQAIFITHAHIDHSGLVPRLVREGYNGPIYASKATADLLRILWLDSAHIQEMEAEWQSRKNSRRGKRTVEPLYETKDAQDAGALIEPIPMDKSRELLPGVEVCFVQAGHILGASSLHITLKGDKGIHRVGFSGDLGRPGQLIVPDPAQMPRPDTVFMETTYGSRRHKTLGDSQKELLQVINLAYQEGGKVLIPAFAVERTQELIYTMAAAWRNDQLPKDMPVFLDSPLAINATRIFREHPEYFDRETQAILEKGDTPLNFPNLKFTAGTDESRAINEYTGPAVIMAGNGMCTAGRIKHHLKHNLWKPNCHLVIVGFQAQGTTGRMLVEGAKVVKIFREPVAVRAQVHTIGGFSAHADQAELLDWLDKIVHPGLRVNLTHGEESSAVIFKAEAKKRFPQVDFHIPRWKETLKLTLKPSDQPMAAAQAADTLETLRARLDRLSLLLEKEGAELAEADISLLEGRLAAAERLLTAREPD